MGTCAQRTRVALRKHAAVLIALPVSSIVLVWMLLPVRVVCALLPNVAIEPLVRQVKAFHAVPVTWNMRHPPLGFVLTILALLMNAVCNKFVPLTLVVPGCCQRIPLPLVRAIYARILNAVRK